MENWLFNNLKVFWSILNGLIGSKSNQKSKICIFQPILQQIPTTILNYCIPKCFFLGVGWSSSFADHSQFNSRFFRNHSILPSSAHVHCQRLNNPWIILWSLLEFIPRQFTVKILSNFLLSLIEPQRHIPSPYWRIFFPLFFGAYPRLLAIPAYSQSYYKLHPQSIKIRDLSGTFCFGNKHWPFPPLWWIHLCQRHTRKMPL